MKALSRAFLVCAVFGWTDAAYLQTSPATRSRATLAGVGVGVVALCGGPEPA